MLSIFGFDADTETVYLALLENPAIEASKLAELLPQEAPAFEAAVANLTGAALVSREGDRLSLVDPEVGLASLLARQQAEVATMQHQLEEGRMAMTRMLSKYGAKAPGESGVEQVIGLKAIRTRIAELAASCVEEQLILAPVGKLSEETFEEAQAVDEDVLKRGVRMKSVYLDAVRNDPFTMEALNWEIDAGGEVRTAPSLPLRMIVFDRERAIIPMDDLDCEIGALILGNRVIIQAMVALFINIWADAQPLTRRRPYRSEPLTAQEQHVLKLWAQGHTDASAARQMKVSHRTIRRLSEDLTKRLGARSRFQLGALATARGLIKEADLI
ncbi:helix-turn-helix transcriptional regulator [Glycomyces sp. NPDC046736]|uniref:helix-turn-helix transcriptional regulator n=1 Tax=Glycomyces sp. NPDC046736 TaxID=3155615 RepID=UPI0033FF0EBE